MTELLPHSSMFGFAWIFVGTSMLLLGVGAARKLELGGYRLMVFVLSVNAVNLIGLSSRPVLYPWGLLGLSVFFAIANWRSASMLVKIIPFVLGSLWALLDIYEVKIMSDVAAAAFLFSSFALMILAVRETLHPHSPILEK